MPTCKDCILYENPCYTKHSRICGYFKDNRKYVEVVRCQKCELAVQGKRGLECSISYDENGQYRGKRPDDYCSKAKKTKEKQICKK